MLGGMKAAVRSFLRRRDEKALYDRIVNTNRNVSQFHMETVYDARRHGFNMTESACYGLNENNWKEYISTWEAYQPRRTDNPFFLISDDKMLFSFAMEGVVEVPRIDGWIVDGKVIPVSEADLTNQNLYDHFLHNGGGVLKARSGYNGFGIHVYKTSETGLVENGRPVDREELEKIIAQAKDSLIQNRVEQGAFENGIYPNAVNTIRIISMRRKNSYEHEVVAAVQRIGTDRSAPMDNFSQGGGAALIDIETGEMSEMTYYDSFDSSGNRLFYDKHPDTGAQIKGVKIPNWDAVKASVVEITRKRPFFDFIAWDIVLKDDGIAVIETNMKSGLTLFQTHKGLKNSFLGEKYREFGYLRE